MVKGRGGDDGTSGDWRAISSLHGINGGHKEGMSATGFQRQRRRLQEQTSVAARMNEDGPGDPHAKTAANYDQRDVKDTGAKHQAGNPPPYSETPHTPEQMHDPTAVEDEGTIHQQGAPPPDSETIRADEEERLGVEGDEYPDQAYYAALDRREAPNTTASEENVALYPGGIETVEEAGEGSDDLENKSVKELKQVASDEDVEGRSNMNRDELVEAIRAKRQEG